MRSVRSAPKWLVFLCACVFIIAAAPVALADDGMSQYTPSVAMVHTSVPNDTGGYTDDSAVGFFITPQYVLTVYDGVRALSEGGNGRLEIVFDKKSAVDAFIVAVDAKKNIALLGIEAPVETAKPLLISKKRAQAGQAVYAIGYKDGAFGDLSLLKSSITITKGVIQRRYVETGNGRNVLETDFYIGANGNGGPLVNEKGAVLGIASMYASQGNMNSAIDILEVLPMLDAAKVSYRVSGGNEGLLILVGVLAVLLAAAVVLIIVMKNKKASADSKKNTPPLAAPIPVQSKPAAAARKPLLCCMAGEHSGLKLSLQGQKIYLGRDVSACRVVFKEGTPGISKVHCLLTFDDATGEFVLTDQNSSYGTYLSTGEKLLPTTPVRLKAKAAFYLGDKENLFFVDFENE